jgi:hypothetical protein
MPLRIRWISSDDKGYPSGLPGGAEQTVGVVARYFSLAGGGGGGPRSGAVGGAQRSGRRVAA